MKGSFRFRLWQRYAIVSLCAVAVFVVASSLAQNSFALPLQPHFNHFLYAHPDGDEFDDGNGPTTAAEQQYENRALPQKYISNTQVANAFNANQSLLQQLTPQEADASKHWQQFGPVTANVAPQATYTGRATVNSGRTTAIVVANDCTSASCNVWIAAAGGGIWRTSNGLADKPDWTADSTGLRSNAIGSLIIDPSDPTGRTLYAGTGEPNGSSDSEAGVGLFKSTDSGDHWSLVSGSVAAAKERAIGSIAIDPTNAQHIYIGTDVARHGASSVNGGRFSPPDAPQIGLYESLDGGRSFKLVFSKTSDIVDPGTPNGNDFFRGGVNRVQFYQSSSGQQLYFAVSDYGVYRTANGSFEQVFASVGGGANGATNSSTAHTDFTLVPNGTKLRIYLADVGDTNPDFYRLDNANVDAKTLSDGTNNPGWTKLSNPTKGTPGYSSYNFCETQCDYDMVIVSPPGHPDTVWLGGSMNYDEITTHTPPSNGRAVLRSTDAGVSFTDMTNDAQTPPQGLHPDQHAIALAPSNPDIAFIGSDGGVSRTSGSFIDSSSDCANRGLSGDDLKDCQIWLKQIPTQITSVSDGLATLQFQSLTVNPADPKHDVIGGTQDNGTFSASPDPRVWTETVGGDGGQSVIDIGNPNIRMHTYYSANGDVNFHGNDPNGWDAWADPLTASKEQSSFYVPLIGDPKISQTMFVGLEHVWRTQDSGGKQDYLDQHCNEITGDLKAPCGDWVALGPNLVDSTFGTDKAGSFVVALNRAPSDTSTLWAATRLGRLFISTNADAAPASVSFTRIDSAAQPNRFISGIAVDPKDKYHAYITYSGYGAYTPNAPGHVFDVKYDPATGKTAWTDVSYNLGDQPITSVAYDSVTGNLFAATDFGVNRLRENSQHWVPAASSLPTVAVYGLTLSESGRVLYAATHGRGAWVLDI